MPLLQILCLLPQNSAIFANIKYETFGPYLSYNGKDILNGMLSSLNIQKNLRYLGFSIGRGLDTSFIARLSWNDFEHKHTIKRCALLEDELPYLPKDSIFSGLYYESGVTIGQEAELPMFMW